MNQLSVCMFSNLFPPVVSGSSTQSYALARELTKRSAKVSVITAKLEDDVPDYEIVDGVSIYRLPALRLPRMRITFNFQWLSLTFTPNNLKRIEEILHQEKTDVIHLHNHMFDLALSALVMTHKYKKPLVLTIHTVMKHNIPIYNLLLYPLDRIVLKIISINPAQIVISPDFNALKYVVETFGRTDSVLIPYGISLPGLLGNSEVNKLLEQYGLWDKKIILSLGHLNEIRNRKDLIDAMPYLLHEVPNAVLLIVGGVASSEPIKRVKNAGLENNVIFTGHVPHKLISAFLELADLEAHWLNQDTPEKTSLGIASLEAMFAGKTILAAANPNTYGEELLVNGENIIIVEPGKPEKLASIIAQLLRDDVRRKAIGQRARQTVLENFSWESVCEKTIKAYEAALEKNRSSRRQ